MWAEGGCAGGTGIPRSSSSFTSVPLSLCRIVFSGTAVNVILADSLAFQFAGDTSERTSSPCPGRTLMVMA